jgi:hypothetical protein
MSKFARAVLAMGLLAGLAVALGVWGPNAATSQDQPEKKPTKKAPDAKLDLDQAEFMRRKLEASGQILEGLVTEDSALLLKGAKVLVEMSSAEKWQVQHNVMYKQYSAEFQAAAKKLVEAAEKENFDGAALKWIDTTMKCMECHKFVRGAKLASAVK